MHARQKIKAAVVALLADLSTTGRRVYPGRVFSLEESELPSWGVFSGPEDVQRITLGAPAHIHRNLTLVLEGRALADERIDEVLDVMAAEAETALAAILTVDGRELATNFKSTEIEFSGDAETQIGLVRLTYIIPYVTREGTPGSIA